MDFIEVLKAIFLGIVEGITEWLPISSTAHMILVDEFIKLNVSDAFREMFFVVIQLGAILAVPVLFFHKLNPFSKKKSAEERRGTWSLWGKVIVGVIPAGILGVLLDDFFNSHFYNYIVVAIALIVYGVAFIVIERLRAGKPFRVERTDELTYRDSLVIGCYQVLSLIPGTSRSGSTILGGMMTGVSRTASAEFSFFMAIPVMIGASLVKILKFITKGYTATGAELGLLAIGIVTAFLVSLAAIRFLMDFVKRHDFKPFGIYRIALGVLVLGYFLVKTVIA
ncbi:MAG TPA: undecaprenyl-diphosphatase [Clostridiales bacterium]|nr:undecaprenyl-diphosphatase [Clostridiales bacterium]